MNKNIFKYLMFGFATMLLNSCNEGEDDLLEPKVFFENKEYRIEVGDGQSSLDYDLQARVSSICSEQVEISYAVADANTVEEYNKKNGTNYEAFDPANVIFDNETAKISGGEVYADKIPVKLSNLENVKEGTPVLLPIRIKSASLPTINGSDIIYLIISKPVRIMNVCKFWSNYIKVPIQAGKPFTSISYEALIYIDQLNSNNTIMGTEGILIFRIGDTALPGGANNLIQIAGNRQYHAPQVFSTKQWYHVAFTYDQPSGKTVIYINGAKAAESSWDTPSFDLSADGGGCFIGKVAGFMWGERPFYGNMSEVRIWSTARTENQIKQNMLTVDPNSDGLEVYYKLNGEDQYQDEKGKWCVKDASGHNMDGSVNGGNSQLNIVGLSEPVTIN